MRAPDHRRSTARPRPPGDGGFTLVEIVMSVALSAILGGVVISILISSLGVVDRTTEIAHDATDAGLIATFLYRDAQAAGGTDPTTLADVPGLGVSTTDWGSCAQDGELVVRFAWIDRLDIDHEHPMTVTWALDAGGVLNRRACQDGASVDAALGEHISSADASCQPGPDCDLGTESIELRITGSTQPNPSTITLSATLRPAAAVLDVPGGIAAPLIAFAGEAGCPEVDLADGRLVVLGNAIVDDGCGPTAIAGDPDLLEPTGQLSVAASVTDPLVASMPTAPDCSPATDPALGSSPSASSVMVHTDPVVVSGTTVLQPGRYVFCQGLTVADGGSLTGDGVTLQVVAGDLVVTTGGHVDLAAPTTGDHPNLLVSVADGDVTIDADLQPAVLRGIVHVAAGRLDVTATTSVAVGAAVADALSTGGAGAVRLGLPIPTLAVEPPELAPAQAEAAYPTVDLVATGGAGPYSWRAIGLPEGLTVTTGGLLSGTPVADGASTVTFVVQDATGLAAVVQRELVVKPALAIETTTLPDGQVGVAYVAPPLVGTGGTPPRTFVGTGMPPGVTLRPDGTFSGTPTAAGTYTVTAGVTDSVFAEATRSYTVTIRPKLVISAPSGLVAGSVGTAYPTTVLTATGGLPPYQFTATGLPTGLALTTAGAISGTPTAAGSFTVEVTASDTGGGVATRTYTVTVTYPPTSANPVERAAAFQVLVEDDALLGTFDIAGAAAVGGDLTFHNYERVATAATSSTVVHSGGSPLGLVVGGRVDLAASGSDTELTVATGWFVVGDATGQSMLAFDTELHLVPAGVTDDSTTPRVRNQANQTALPPSSAVMPDAFPFADTFASLRATSVRLSALGPSTCADLATPSLSEADGNHTLTLTADRVNVWNLTIAQMEAIQNLSGPVPPSATTPLVINIADTGDLVVPVRYWELLTSRSSSILWNFPNATSISITSSFPGTLLAPSSAVSMVDVNVEGDVIAATLDFRPWGAVLARFTSSIPCLGSGDPYVATPGKLSALQRDVAMSPATFTGGGGSAPYTWSATGLPGGLTLSSSGVLGGTPTAAGTFDPVVTITDATGTTATRTYRLVVNEKPTISGPTALPDGQDGVAYTATSVVVSGGTSPYTWSAAGLPAGLTISGTGLIGGTPTNPTLDAPAAVTVTVRDAYGVTATRTYSLFVADATVPAGCPLNPAGWRGEYYANQTLSGAPALCRDDPAVDFDWGGASPGGSIPGTNFSVRWTRRQSFVGGTYQFVKGSDDGLRVFVDGVVVIDDWRLQSYSAANRAGQIDLTAGYHTIVVEYFQGPGLARVDVTWATIVSQACGEPTGAAWTGEYFANANLIGSPVLCRDDAAIDFDWASGSPSSPTLPSDGFSVRWSKIVTFGATGTYRFTAGSDDGVRVYVDGVRIIDRWSDRSYGLSVADYDVTAGDHVVVFEFYENGGLARATLTWAAI